MSRRRAGLDAPASTTTRTGRPARAGRVVTGMVAGRGGAVGATIARRAGGARARPCTQKAIDLANWLPRCPAGSVRRPRTFRMHDRSMHDQQYEKRPTCNCSTVDLGEISRAFLWEMYGRKVRAVPECMQCTRVHQKNAPSWLAGARAGSFQPVILLGNVGEHARAAFSL